MFIYFKMKRNQWKIKNAIYSNVLSVMNNRKEIVSFSKKLFEAFKDSSVEEIREKFVSSLAQIIHEENKSENN